MREELEQFNSDIKRTADDIQAKLKGDNLILFTENGFGLLDWGEEKHNDCN